MQPFRGARRGEGMTTDWEGVYQAQYRRLVALVVAISGSRTEAEEAVQEAFVRALGMTGRRDVDDPGAWLYRVAVNIIRSRWRRALVARRAGSRLAGTTEYDVREQVDGR